MFCITDCGVTQCVNDNKLRCCHTVLSVSLSLCCDSVQMTSLCRVDTALVLSHIVQMTPLGVVTLLSVLHSALWYHTLWCDTVLPGEVRCCAHSVWHSAVWSHFTMMSNRVVAIIGVGVESRAIWPFPRHTQSLRRIILENLEHVVYLQLFLHTVDSCINKILPTTQITFSSWNFVI